MVFLCLLIFALMFRCYYLAENRDWYKKQYEDLLNEARPLFQRQELERKISIERGRKLAEERERQNK